MTLTFLKKYTKTWLAINCLGFSFLFLTACDTPKEIGSELFSVEVGLNYTDTLSLDMGTVLVDSVYSNASAHYFLGTLSNPYIGAVRSSFFTQFANIDSIKASETSRYESLKMRLVYKSFMGDTNQVQRFNLYRLKDSLVLSRRYLTNSTVAYDPSPIGTFSFTPRPLKGRTPLNDSLRFDTLDVMLPASLGREFLSNYKDKTIAGGGSGFRKSFYGFYVESANTSNNTAIIGFNPAYSSIELKYRNAGDTVSKVIPYYFSLTTALTNQEVQARFNRIEAQRTGSMVANLTKVGDFVDAKRSNHRSFVAKGAGLATYIKIPYLKNLIGNRYLAVNKAELVLESSGEVPKEEILQVLSLAKVNDQKKLMRNSNGVAFLTAEGGASFQTAVYNENTKTYTFNITSHMQNMLSGREKAQDFMVTSDLSSISSTEAGLIVDQIKYISLNSLKAKIKLYYSFVAK